LANPLGGTADTTQPQHQRPRIEGSTSAEALDDRRQTSGRDRRVGDGASASSS
jgi:hypothetical protein